jgi:hypothetical protein
MQAFFSLFSSFFWPGVAHQETPKMAEVELFRRSA